MQYQAGLCSSPNSVDISQVADAESPALLTCHIAANCCLYDVFRCTVCDARKFAMDCFASHAQSCIISPPSGTVDIWIVCGLKHHAYSQQSRNRLQSSTTQRVCGLA